MQAVKYMFPFLEWTDESYRDNLKRTTLKKDCNVMYMRNDIVMYGKVAADPTSSTMMVYPYSFNNKEALTGCYEFSSGRLSTIPHLVHSSEYMGQFMMTKGFVNKYVTLQLIKL